VSLGSRAEVDAGLYRVGRLRAQDIPAYTRLDARVELRLKDGLSFVATGQNLLDPSHPEFSTNQMQRSLVRRNGHLQLVWAF
jgi:iron complex outermembrane receptor protein